MALCLKKWKLSPEQVQDFYPTPGTISTVIYYTGIHPMTEKPVYVCRDYKEKQMQRALLQYANPKNYDLVHEALIRANRRDLIGNGEGCLIKERKTSAQSAIKKSGARPQSNVKTSKNANNSLQKNNKKLSNTAKKAKGWATAKPKVKGKHK
jgi:sRNA-binding protein